MRVLTAHWSTLNRVSDAVVTGELASDEVETLAEKPYFIYVTDGLGSVDGEKIEKVILNDNKVLIGMRVFNAVKMTLDAVSNDPLLADRSKDDNYFIFVSRDHSKVKVVDGTRMKSSIVFKTMRKFASREYKGNFVKIVKSILKLTLEYDKINGARKILLRKKNDEDISKSEKRKVEKELAELDEAQEEAEAKEKELLDFRLKH